MKCNLFLYSHGLIYFGLNSIKTCFYFYETFFRIMISSSDIIIFYDYRKMQLTP